MGCLSPGVAAWAFTSNGEFKEIVGVGERELFWRELLARKG